MSDDQTTTLTETTSLSADLESFFRRLLAAVGDDLPGETGDAMFRFVQRAQKVEQCAAALSEVLDPSPPSTPETLFLFPLNEGRLLGYAVRSCVMEQVHVSVSPADVDVAVTRIMCGSLVAWEGVVPARDGKVCIRFEGHKLRAGMLVGIEMEFGDEEPTVCARAEGRFS